MMAERKEQYEAAVKICKFVGEGKNVLVSAEEKSGKRTIVEIVALLDWDKYYTNGGAGARPVNIYVVGLLRNDCKVQLEEMRDDYGIITHAVKGKKGAIDILEGLARNISEGAKVHIDECDYASGKDQALAPFWEKVQECSGFNGILYSATPEEVYLSAVWQSLMDEDKVGWVPLCPSSDYSGAEFFLENGLVHESSPFWDSGNKKWTDHGQELVDSLKENAISLDPAVRARRVGVVRLQSHKSCTDYRECIDTLNGKAQEDINVMFVDKDNSFEWGNRLAWMKECNEHDYELCVIKPKALLLVICATCTRSTELAGHEFIKFWHDNRSLDKCAYTTLSQALGRIKHYGANHIELYSDTRVYKLNSGSDDISFAEVDRVAGRVKGRDVKVCAESSVCLETSWQDKIEGTPLVWKTNADLVNPGDTPASLFPGSSRSSFKWSSVTAKWTNADGEFRYMGDCKVKQSWFEQADTRYVLMYKSPDSDEFTIRVFMKDPNVDYSSGSDDEEIVTRRHETSKSSMFGGGGGGGGVSAPTPIPSELPGIDRDIRSMRIPELKDAIRNDPRKKCGDLKGNKADLQKALIAIRQRAEVVENDEW